MPRIERETILAKLQAMKTARTPIVGGGAGAGLSAKCGETGGIDLIVICNSGEMTARARAKGMLTTPYVFWAADADVIVCMTEQNKEIQSDRPRAIALIGS
jgi:predicted TIM-barrel enzyme